MNKCERNVSEKKNNKISSHGVSSPYYYLMVYFETKLVNDELIRTGDVIFVLIYTPVQESK